MDRRTMIGRAAALLAAIALPQTSFAKAEPVFSSDRITVRVEGKGGDVVLIPGLGSSPRIWSEMIRAVPGHRYHLVQLSGFAGQPAGGAAGEGPVAAPAAAEIARYIRTAKLKTPVLIGHSMGGAMAIMVTGRNPGLISKMMVVDQLPFMGAAFGPPGTTAESVKPVADAIAAQMRADPENARKERAERIAKMISNPSVRVSAAEDALNSDLDVSVRSLHELITTDLSPELARITAPATVLYVTSNNMSFTPAQVDGFYAASYAPLKGAKLVSIPDSGHFVMWDTPERFQSEVKAFLGK